MQACVLAPKTFPNAPLFARCWQPELAEQAACRSPLHCCHRACCTCFWMPSVMST